MGEDHTFGTSICQAVSLMAVIFFRAKRQEGVLVKVRDVCGGEGCGC